jgi:hypothetical protein
MDQMNPSPIEFMQRGALRRATGTYPINPNGAKELSGQSVRNVANGDWQEIKSAQDTSGA